MKRKEIRQKKKIKRSKKVYFVRFMSLFVILVVAISAVIYVQAEKTLTKTHVNTKIKSSSISAKKPLTILLMGVDTGDNSRGGADSWNGNSDSQIILTLNPRTKTTTIISVERDTMTNIEDASGKIQSTQKMNAAYPLGFNNGGLSSAVTYAMKTIGNQVGLNLNNFMIVNMDGLVNLVNDVGGVEVVNDTNGSDVYQGTDSGKITLPGSDKIVDSGAIYISNTEPEYKAYVPYLSGNPKQLINGEQALVFARDRDTLANGNYGRAAHQREVMTELMNKMLSLNSVFKYQSFLNDISSDFKTNISINLANLTALMAYKDCLNKVVSVQYQGVSQMVDGGSYEFIPENVDLAIQNIMRQANDESVTDKLDQSVITYENYFGSQTDQYYMPSATVTIKGEKSETYGVDTKGSLVKINKENAQDYVSSQGGALAAN